ncbi:MAG: M1 family metallopeptidase [Bacteroidia bacterium]
MKKLIFVAVVFLIACNNKHPDSYRDQNSKQSMIQDVHSFSQPNDAVVTHLDLNLNVDFDKKVLSGSATWDIENKTEATEIIFDTKDLNVSKVLIDETETDFLIGDEKPFLGRPLNIVIKPTTKKVTVYYTTSPEAGALQWLLPAQTAGGKQPFLFTQSQAILARTWIPCQDSPGIKFTYKATVTCPKQLMALMSAENDTVIHPDGIYHFNMPQPVSSYLMALAVGDLQFHSYSPISGVYAEPSMLAKCVYEFEDMPKMISAAEDLYGKYAWGRYDLLVLPPSFPFGGMENPRLTFATPTIIAGDRSLVALVAHELAHSWSGNLVTNATWDDFWLNEGFTVYFETRIMEKLYGKDYADMLTVLSYTDLLQTVDELNKENPNDTKLYLDLKDRDPDDGMNDIAYEKGRFFLTTIEHEVGREKFDAFLKKYFATYQFHSMDTKTFLEYLNTELIKGDTVLASRIDVDAWVYQPGIPANCVLITSTELKKADDAITAFKNGTPAASLVTKGWTTHHWLQFIRGINDSTSLDKMKKLDNTFHFTQSGNTEIQCEWYTKAIRSNYKTAYPAIENFLTHVGRRKFVKPLFAELVKTPDGKEFAKHIYAKARAGYHSVTQGTIDEMVK